PRCVRYDRNRRDDPIPALCCSGIVEDTYLTIFLDDPPGQRFDPDLTDAPGSTHSLEVPLVQAAGAQEDHQDGVERGAGGVAQRGQAVQERNDLAPVVER